MDFVFIDFAKTRRGGQIYVERLANSLSDRGRVCRLHLREREGRVGLLVFFIEAIKYICHCKAWIIGTAPSFLPVVLVTRYPVLLIQSPINEWSWKARVLLKLALRKKRKVVICVSDYVKDELTREYNTQALVVYAQIPSRAKVDHAQEVTYKRCEKKIALALMNPREFGKGYLSSISLIEKASRDIKVVVDVYGDVKAELGELDRYCDLEYHGFVQEPFEHFSARRSGWKRAYLGMSHFEGLHMAVVEAGQRDIPSILSDIPAHRELEKLAGQRLMIGKEPSECFALMKMMVDEDVYYERMVMIYRRMSEVFVRKAEREIIRILELVLQLEAGEMKKWN